MRCVLGLAIVCLGCAVSAAGYADPVQLYSRASLTSQVIDWSSFGSPGTTISTPTSFAAGAETVTIGSSSGTALLRQQGTDFTGNFAPGDALLSLPDGDKSDAFDVQFGGAPVNGLGAQIDPVSGYTGAFTGVLKLYGSGGVFLGQVSVAGDATDAADGSAVFLGASSSIPIEYAVFFVDEGAPFFPLEGDLAINQLSLQEAIPEPPASLVLAPMLLLVAAFRARRPVRA
jgi:hypothetical protein